MCPTPNNRRLEAPRWDGFYALPLFSPKVARPVRGCVAWIRRAALLAQLAVYGAAAAAWLAPRLGRAKPFAIPLYFCLVNLAALRAAWNVLTGTRIDVWEPKRCDARADAATRRQLRGSSLLLAGRLLSKGANLAIQVLIVRHLARSEFGAFAWGISIV